MFIIECVAPTPDPHLCSDVTVITYNFNNHVNYIVILFSYVKLPM